MKNYELYKHDKVESLKEFLLYCAEHYNTKPAFMYENKKQKTVIDYSHFKTDVEAFGIYLYKNGNIGCHIAVFGENSYEWILTYFAVTCGKNVIVPLNKDLDADGAAELLTDSCSQVLVFSDTYLDIAEEIQKKLPELTYINMKEIPELVKEGNVIRASGYTDYVLAEVDKDDLASIVYTSGTTGKSKGVMLTHNNFCSNIYGLCSNLFLSGPSLLVLPLHHTYGLLASLFVVMFYGLPIYINQSLKDLPDDFKKCRPQHIFVVPLILEALYKSIWITARKQGKEKSLKARVAICDTLRKCKIDLRKVLLQSVMASFGGAFDLIISGGAPIDQKYIHAFESFGITVLNGYGITECGPVVSVNRNKCNVIGSVGMPLCCNEVRTADNGEILVKGENVMKGYYQNSIETEKAFADGWFKTGDIGFIDTYGALYITGRIKNLIILGNGENISAEALEEQIYTIPYVKETIAYGKDNRIVAEIYLDEAETKAKEKIHSDIQKINRRLPSDWNIGKVLIRDTAFPKTATNKIIRPYNEV